MPIPRSIYHPGPLRWPLLPTAPGRCAFATLLIGAALSLTVHNARSGSLSTAYTDPRYQVDVTFGAHSHWIQPWRAYLETVPAAEFLNGLGVVLSSTNNPDLILQHLAKHGIKLTRIEIGWSNLSFNDDSLSSPSLHAALQACRKWGIRPIILLNSNHSVPCPVRFFYRTVTADAVAGAATVQLDDTTGLVLGRSGLCDLTDGWAAEALITAIKGNTVTLSKPLPKAIAASARVRMATLKYRPFSPSGTADYEETLAAWQKYVQTVADFAAHALGTADSSDKGFDLEVWNELTFGSNFLSINRYYQPALYKYKETDIWTNLVHAAADCVQRNPAAFRGVGLGDGFANTMPWPCSSKEPLRVGAVCKHPYPPDRTFPSADNGSDSIDAQLRFEKAGWVPAYRCAFPEYSGTAIQTEHVIRDMSPITTDIYGNDHGRYARIVHGRPVECDEWITETGCDPHQFGVTDAAAALNLKAKTTARFFCFYLQKGVRKLTLYASDAGDLGYGIVQDNFIQYTRGNRTYPADDSSYTSPALSVTKRVVDKMSEGLDPGLKVTRSLQVNSVSDTHDHFQFAGDGHGTAAHPPLYDREVLAFLPFQVNANRFVIAYYVMTRDVTQSLAPEPFTIGLTGLNAARLRARAYDPLNDREVPVAVKSGAGENRIDLTADAADYPYLLIIDDAPGS